MSWGKAIDWSTYIDIWDGVCAGENIAALDTSQLQAISENGGDKTGHGKKYLS